MVVGGRVVCGSQQLLCLNPTTVMVLLLGLWLLLGCDNNSTTVMVVCCWGCGCYWALTTKSRFYDPVILIPKSSHHYLVTKRLAESHFVRLVKLWLQVLVLNFDSILTATSTSNFDFKHQFQTSTSIINFKH